MHMVYLNSNFKPLTLAILTLRKYFLPVLIYGLLQHNSCCFLDKLIVSLFPCALLGLSIISYLDCKCSAARLVFLLCIFTNRSVCKIHCAMAFSEPWLN